MYLSYLPNYFETSKHIQIHIFLDDFLFVFLIRKVVRNGIEPITIVF